MKNKVIIQGAFWLLILFAIYSILNILYNFRYRFEIPNLRSSLKPISINIIPKQKIDKNIFVCFNSYCRSLDKGNFGNIYSYKFDANDSAFYQGKVKNIYIVYPQELKNFNNSIETLDLHIGTKDYYYSQKDVFKFTRKDLTMTLEDSKDQKKYSAIKLPVYSNYQGILNHISVLFLSLFYNWNFFIIPYFWLFIAYFIYFFNKDKFSFKLSKKSLYLTLISTILLSIFLRIVDISYYPLWTDEVYTKVIAIESLKSCFMDPGNPPLFFVLEYLITKVLPKTDFILRLLPLVFGVMLTLSVFLLFKNIDKKQALLAAFLISVNSINIYHSQEARGYSLCAFLSVFSLYLLFNYLKKTNFKNLFFYGIATILLVNSNYYLVLLAFTNFIWGVFSLVDDKKKKEILKFSIVNLLSGLTFIPYLVLSSSNALSQGFNGWIGELSKETFLYTINAYFINKHIFLILCFVLLANLIYCFVTKINDRKNLFMYLVYSLTFILIIAAFISIFIKPIIHKRVLLSLYGMFFLVEFLIITGTYQLKKLKPLGVICSIILTCLYFSITTPMPLREVCNLNGFMNLIAADAPRYSKDYEIHAVTCDNEQYLKAYPQVLKLDNIHWHYIDTNNGSYITSIKKTDYADNDKNAIIYFNSIGVDTQRISFFNPKSYIFYSNLTPGGKIVF